MSATPENGHLQLGMAIGSILLTSGSFIRRVLYYNVYTILHVIIPKLVYLLYNTLQYFTILYNTIQCTVRIKIHYISQDVPAVAVCFSTPGSLQYIYRVLGGFS